MVTMSESNTPEQTIDPELARGNLAGVTGELNAMFSARKVMPERQADGAIYTSISEGDDDSRVVLTRTQYPDGSKLTHYSTSVTSFRLDEEAPTKYRTFSTKTRSWEAGEGVVKTSLYTNEDRSIEERVDPADMQVCRLVRSDLVLANVLWQRMASAQETAGNPDGVVPGAVAGLAIRQSSEDR